VKKQPVIVGIDGSPDSLHAAAIASRIAQASSRACVFVYAIPPLRGLDGSADIIDETIVDRLGAHVRKMLASAHLPGRVIVRTGKAGVVLHDVARERGAGLIVVAGRHHGALTRSLGASTAHHLVRTAEAPVLVVDPRTDTIDRVLAAVDLSAAAGPTLAAAARFSELLGARLRVVHAVEPAKYPLVIPLSLDQEEYERRRRAEFDRFIETELPDLPPDDRIVRAGLAEEKIAEEAAAWSGRTGEDGSIAC
jgi:nucleotide-binding universal stress UspA family protein